MPARGVHIKRYAATDKCAPGAMCVWQTSARLFAKDLAIKRETVKTAMMRYGTSEPKVRTLNLKPPTQWENLEGQCLQLTNYACFN